MQPSCQSRSLWLKGMKYLQARAKPLHVPLAGTLSHKALPNHKCSAWRVIKQSRDLSLCNLLAPPVQKPPFSLGFEIPSHVLADFFCLSIIKEQESSPEFPVPIVMSPLS